MRYRVSRRARLVALVIAAAVVVLAIIASPLLRAPPRTPAWTGWLNGGLEQYADTAGQWNSGDNAVQVALPDGQALWLFNDSYYGPVRPDGTVSTAEPFVHNLILLTSGSDDMFTVRATITGQAGSAQAGSGVPSSAVPAIEGAPSSWAWPADGIVAGNSVEAIYNVFTRYASGSFDYMPVANELVSMPLASLTRPSTYRLQPSASADCGYDYSGCIQWGISLLSATQCPVRLASCVYIYGEAWATAGGSSRTLVVAVAPAGELGDPDAWWYDTGGGWSRTPADLATPAGRNASFRTGSVYQLSSREYVVLGSDPYGDMIAYYSPVPWLSDARRVPLYMAPSGGGIPGFLPYQFHIEPAYSSGASVVIGFSVDSFDHDQACVNFAPYFDVAAYQPEFYSITLPVPAPATVSPGTLPPPQLRVFPRASARLQPSALGREVWSSTQCH
jgi:hypothetical protein